MVRSVLMHLLIAWVSIVASSSTARSAEQGIGDFPELNAQTDWPWWRGPTRDGKAAGAAPPTKFGDQENMAWKVQVPGRGHSSPIVVGERVFLTTAFEERQRHCVLAFDRSTGQELWQVEVNQGGFPAKNHPKNTEATPSVACDGERLFVTFYHHDQVELITLGLDGKIGWRKQVAHFRPRMYEYGYAPSPVLYQQTVIVATEYDGDSFLTAFDRRSGQQSWRTKRLPLMSFSTPSIGFVAGQDQLMISGQEFVTSYNPTNGKPLWVVKGTTFATCGTMVWEGNIVFASGGYPKSETIAVRADGSNEVLWTNNQKCYEQSMIVHDGHLYALNDSGVMFCWHGKTGQEQWKRRLAGPVSASPVLANGNIYWANEAGTMYVVKASPQKFELVAENTVGSSAFASPALCGGQIFLRVADGEGAGRQEWLYCFAQRP